MFGMCTLSDAGGGKKKHGGLSRLPNKNNIWDKGIKIIGKV